MFRLLPVAGFAVVSLGLTGCAGTWDTLTSRRFRDHPWDTTKKYWAPEDPVAVLLAEPPRPWYEQRDALKRLKEPLRNRGTPEDQDAVLAALERTAVHDPSPVLRMEAIETLGRFEDERAAGYLMAAYQSAHGRKASDPTPPPRQSDADVIAAAAGVSAGRAPTAATAGLFPITGPTGFPPEWVGSIRCRALMALGRTNRPEAVRFLAAVAGADGPDIAPEGNDDRDVRLAALRGLGECRQPEAVVALAQVLQNEAGKPDTAVVGRAHKGLVDLTRKNLPPDPQQWNEVVQAGAVVAPPPTWFESVVEQAMFWEKR